MRTAYVSGPMTGLPDANYPAFYAAEERLQECGFDVLCPAHNFDGQLGLPRWLYMRQDINNVLQADLLVVLPDWQNSAGARLEVCIARELNLPVYDLSLRFVNETVYTLTDSQGKGFAMRCVELGAACAETTPAPPLDPSSPPPSPHSVLEEAQGLIHGDRQGSYGHPFDDFTRTGRLWGAILETGPIEPERVGLMMTALKISRSCNDLHLGRPIKRDNLVDGCGYLGTVEMVQEFRDGNS